jgi:acetyl-CoA acetyltransferase
MRDVAIVSYARSAPEQPPGMTEQLLLVPVLSEALERAGLARRDVDFTCSASADYLAGPPFAFVQNLEATGAWPPISESHVEMDGAWALFEAWIQLQCGDADTALVFASGICSNAQMDEVLALRLDPYYLAPLWPDHVALAALQAQSHLAATGRTERDLAAVTARSRRAAAGNPHALVDGDATPDELLAAPCIAPPLRALDCAPFADAAVAVVLAAGDRARELCARPAWIRGIDHRIDAQYPGQRDLSSATSARQAAEGAGVALGEIEVAELAVSFSHEELMLRDALGLAPEVEVNPTGGTLVENPLVANGLVRLGEAFRHVSEGGRHRVVAHASSGQCLQQNLVCVLEGDG